MGAGPDMLHPTHDCGRLVIALEGEAYVSGGAVIDPPGGVGIVSFPNGIAKNIGVKYDELDFSKFNDKWVKRFI